MILVKITGGPGNQLFQYAFGRKLALINNTKLFLDLSEFNIKKHRKFLLHKFNIDAHYASPEFLKTFLKFSYYFPYDFRPLVHYFLPFLYKNIVYEKQFTFNNDMLKVKNNSYLIGFWQSEKYFSKIKNKLNKELTLKKELSKESRKILEKIKKTNSVSLNVRRGDFLVTQNFKRHGVIGLSYFKNAMDYVASKITKPHLFLFSDDIDWVKKNIKPRYPSTYIDFNFPQKSEEDLVLGSKCKHHILTNSTFSWWVGWLNDNPQKIVTVPKKWFNQLYYDTSDLFPKKWIKM